MCNSFIRSLVLALCATVVFGSASDLRITAVSLQGRESATIQVAGLQSAVSNGCPWLSLSFCDSLGQSLWGATQWRYDYGPVAMHRYDALKNYQRFSGAHFWRAVCNSNGYELATTPAVASVFSVGDTNGYVIVDFLTDIVAKRVYPGSVGDGAFIYSDFFQPHWMVWTTNAGATYQTGWPWINVFVTNNDTYTFAGVPITWRIATKAAPLQASDDFALLPGVRGDLAAFYVALTEVTEGTVSAVISNGVAMGLCAAGSFSGTAGRGADYPETGRTLGEVAALCNLATRLHNAVTGEALTPVYRVTNAVFYVPVSNVVDVVRDEVATGYRLPSVREYGYAAAGDARTVFPWGSSKSHEWFFATNGVPVSETILVDPVEIEAFYRKYELAETNSTANFLSRNGARHGSSGRVSAVRSLFRSWSVPVVNTNGDPVVWQIGGFGGPMYFGDSTTDGAWGSGLREVHDLAGNVSEMAWPPVTRPWSGTRVPILGGAPSLDAAFARADAQASCPASNGRATVGFRFARNKIEVSE